MAHACVANHIKYVGEDFGNGDLLRHMIIDSIRKVYVKNRKKYGRMIIATDAKYGIYWRHDIFPHYKYKRKKNKSKQKESDNVDWNLVYQYVDEVQSELDEFFNWTVIGVDKAEADDIIGVIAKYRHLHEPILIVSRDHDFRQLLKYKGVKLFDPIAGKSIQCSNPVTYLKEHTIKGDAGDGVPNILSPDNIFTIEGGRQKAVMKKKLEVWLGQKPEDFCNTDMMERWKLNKQLVDLEQTPDYIKEQTLNRLEEDFSVKRMKTYNYFCRHKLKKLMENMGDFHE